MATPKLNLTKSFFEAALKNHTIDDVRMKLLLTIADKITAEYIAKNKVYLNFICTHNSRRSQLAQVWSFFAANYFQLNNISAFSGGTEATAFHKNTVKTLQSVGFTFDVIDFSHQNPKYAISFEESSKSLIGFSKTFDDVQNTKPYMALTTCNAADKNCPFIPDALHRFHVPFVDPKIADGSNDVAKMYSKISGQIAGEIGVIFSEVKKLNGES